MSRAVAAGLVGRSADWLKKVETGVRPLNSLPLLVELARVLGVDDVAELTGPQFDGSIRLGPRDVHHVVPAIRLALTDSSFTVLGGSAAPVLTPPELSCRVTRLGKTWHRSPSQRSEVGTALPALIRQSHASIRAAEGRARRQCQAAAGDLYRLVQRLLAHICEPELHALAVERGRACSEEADTARSISEAAWASSVGLCAAGHHDAAASLADRAIAALLRSYTADLTPAAMGTLGALQLEAAAAHGLAGNDGNAHHYLDAAATTARRMPSTAWHLPSAFDHSNVEIMAVIVGVGLRRDGEALNRAQRIDISGIRSVVRRSRLLLECANAHANRREFTDAVRQLDAATQVSAEAVSLIPWARTLADELEESAPPNVRCDAGRVVSILKSVH